jgi:hypothetical protein
LTVFGGEVVFFWANTFKLANDSKPKARESEIKTLFIQNTFLMLNKKELQIAQLPFIRSGIYF